jgi:alginate O-acetyltransferase complex protein AlgF
MRYFLAFCCLGLSSVAAQLLYEPEPPANSAFVRIVNLTGKDQTSKIGRVLFDTLKAFAVSPYRVISQGRHTFQVESSTTEVNFVAQKFYTITAQAKTPMVFEDTSATRAKALISVYNLSDLTLINLKTNDNKITVVADVKPNTVKSQFVNALKIGFLLTQGTTRVVEFPSVQLERGFSYSAFVFASNKTLWLTNTTQR